MMKGTYDESKQKTEILPTAENPHDPERDFGDRGARTNSHFGRCGYRRLLPLRGSYSDGKGDFGDRGNGADALLGRGKKVAFEREFGAGLFFTEMTFSRCFFLLTKEGVNFFLFERKKLQKRSKNLAGLSLIDFESSFSRSVKKMLAERR